MRVNLLVFLFLAVLAGVAGSREIIIESRDGGSNSSMYSEIKGSWNDSISKSTVTGCSLEDIGSRFVIIDGIPPEAEARFTPEIPKEGKYDIFVTWGRSGNANNVKYVIDTGQKKEVKYLDQAGWGGAVVVNADMWHELGTYDLPKGIKAYIAVESVEVNGKPSEPNSGRAYTDAVKLVPHDKSAIAATPRVTQSEPTLVSTNKATLGEFPFSAPPPTSPNKSPFLPIAPGATPAPVFTPFQTIVQPASTPFYQTGAFRWYTSYPEAINAGTANRKSILLFFRSALGRMSRDMETQVMNNPRVAAKLAQHFICCQLDISKNRQICSYYAVFKAPVIVFLDSRGYSRARIDSVLTPDQLLVELEKFK